MVNDTGVAEFYAHAFLRTCRHAPVYHRYFTVAVDCQTNAANQDVLLTITGTVGTPAVAPAFVSVVGCAAQFPVTNTGGVLTATLAKASCANMAWVCTTLDCTRARIQEFLPGGGGPGLTVRKLL